MKKLFILLAACLFVLASCEPEPVLSLDKETLKFSEASGSATVYVTANNDWTVTADNAFYTVSPMAGSQSGYLNITVEPNTTPTNRTATLTVSCTSRSETVRKTLTIEQSCAAGDAEIQSYVMTPPDGGTGIIAAEGGIITMHVQGNAPWSLTCDASDVTLHTDYCFHILCITHCHDSFHL